MDRIGFCPIMSEPEIVPNLRCVWQTRVYFLCCDVSASMVKQDVKVTDKCSNVACQVFPSWLWNANKAWRFIAGTKIKTEHAAMVTIKHKLLLSLFTYTHTFGVWCHGWRDIKATPSAIAGQVSTPCCHYKKKQSYIHFGHASTGLVTGLLLSYQLQGLLLHFSQPPLR